MKFKSSIYLTSLFLFISQLAFADGDANLPPPDQSFWQTLVMIGIAFVFFYVILWRPEQKKRKELEQQRDTMKKGDRVVAMGMIGTVVRVGEQTVIVKMYDNTSKVEFYKAAITDILAETDESKKDVKTNEDE